MKEIQILLVEDTAYVEVALKSRIEEMGFRVSAILAKPEAVVEYMENNTVDIVLSDIFSGETYSGLQLSNDLYANTSTPVILLNGEEGIDPQELIKAKAYGLLLKPVNDVELAFLIRAATSTVNSSTENEKKQAAKSKDYIFVRADYRLNKIRVNDIYYLEAKKDYVTIHTGDNVYTVHATMKEMQQILPSEFFIRTHRSYIVNIDKIFSIKYPDILIENKMKVIQIGGFYRKAVFNKINII